MVPNGIGSGQVRRGDVQPGMKKTKTKSTTNEREKGSEFRGVQGKV